MKGNHCFRDDAVTIICLMFERTKTTGVYWLAESLLLASGLGMTWLSQVDLADLAEPFESLMMPAAFLLSGTAIGGLFRRMALGAMFGATLFCAVALWIFWTSGFRLSNTALAGQIVAAVRLAASH